MTTQPKLYSTYIQSVWEYFHANPFDKTTADAVKYFGEKIQGVEQKIQILRTRGQLVSHLNQATNQITYRPAGWKYMRPIQFQKELEVLKNLAKAATKRDLEQKETTPEVTIGFVDLKVIWDFYNTSEKKNRFDGLKFFGKNNELLFNDSFDTLLATGQIKAFGYGNNSFYLSVGETYLEEKEFKQMVKSRSGLSIHAMHNELESFKENLWTLFKHTPVLTDMEVTRLKCKHVGFYDRAVNNMLSCGQLTIVYRNEQYTFTVHGYKYMPAWEFKKLTKNEMPNNAKEPTMSEAMQSPKPNILDHVLNKCTNEVWNFIKSNPGCSYLEIVKKFDPDNKTTILPTVAEGLQNMLKVGQVEATRWTDNFLYTAFGDYYIDQKTFQNSNETFRTMNTTSNDTPIQFAAKGHTLGPNEYSILLSAQQRLSVMFGFTPTIEQTIQHMAKVAFQNQPPFVAYPGNGNLGFQHHQTAWNPSQFNPQQFNPEFANPKDTKTPSK